MASGHTPSPPPPPPPFRPRPCPTLCILRVVRIKDRRLGILSYTFKAIIAIYIVMCVVVIHW
jgi:hypothetical protein